MSKIARYMEYRNRLLRLREDAFMLWDDMDTDPAVGWDVTNQISEAIDSLDDAIGRLGKT